MTQPLVSALRRESFAPFAPSLRPLPVKGTSGAMVDATIRNIEKRFCEALDLLEEVKEAKNDSKPRQRIAIENARLARLGQQQAKLAELRRSSQPSPTQLEQKAQ